ncbi:MAG: SprB repeat-containing protein, partial [Thermoanaerobaculia bacterium]|nr:SprB repeat-containing protein [Thermoanaerobaculia bacterium]
VTDALGCTAVTVIDVREPKRLVVDSIKTVDVACFGGNTGSAAVFAQGGVLPYTFSWNGMKTGQTLTGLIAGVYTVTLSDSKGCTAVANTLVGEPPDIIINITLLQPETCAGAC